jgi:hypothetical protein
MVTEYHDCFLQLARYAPAEVANDGDKQVSVFNRLPIEGYTQGGKFWVRRR